MSILDRIITHGNRSLGALPDGTNIIRCVDGFQLSVIAGEGTYCYPRPDRYGVLGDVDASYAGPYTHVEVSFPSTRPEPWEPWSGLAEDPESPTETVYGQVPVELVRQLVAAHGGEAVS